MKLRVEPSRTYLDPDIYILDIGFLFINMKGPVLKTKQITLRTVVPEDAKVFVQWFKDKTVIKHLLVQNSPGLAEEKKWVKNVLADKNKIVWSILAFDKKLIGNTMISLDKGNKIASFGIVIGEKEYWGKGYAVEALGLLKKYVFETLKYVRFELEYHVDNKRAKRAYEKVGFKVEGIRRKSTYNSITKQFEDKIIMSILNTEYFKK